MKLTKRQAKDEQRTDAKPTVIVHENGNPKKLSPKPVINYNILYNIGASQRASTDVVEEKA